MRVLFGLVLLLSMIGINYWRLSLSSRWRSTVEYFNNGTLRFPVDTYDIVFFLTRENSLQKEHFSVKRIYQKYNQMREESQMKAEQTLRGFAEKSRRTYIHCIEEEMGWANVTYYDANENWEAIFERNMTSKRAAFESYDNKRYDDDYRGDPSVTEMRLEELPNISSPIIYGHSICYSYSSNQIRYFRPDGRFIPYREKNRHYFYWGWTIREDKHAVPSQASWISEPGIYLSVPNSNRHLGHFVETVNHLLIKLIDPSALPNLKALYLPQFSWNYEYTWSKEYLTLLLSLFPEKSRPKLYLVNNISMIAQEGSDPSILCFKTLTLLDRLRYNGDGGVFGGPLSADLMRSAAYKHAHVGKRLFADKKMNLLFVEREGSRAWVDGDRYFNSIRKHFGNRCEVSRSSYSNFNLADHVRTLYNADIAIGIHGSAMVNVFMMLPHSVEVECDPPFFYEMWFVNIAMMSNVHSIIVSSFRKDGLTESLLKAEKYYAEGEFFSHRREYIAIPPRPEMSKVMWALDDAYEYAYRYRFAFQPDEFYRHIFI